VSGATASVSCGNLYATGAISIGSIGSIGGDDCKVAADQLADFAIEDGVSSFDQVGVVNIDFQTGGTAYVGLGVLGSDSDTMWNSVGPLGSGGTNLLFADGSGPSGISVTTTHGNGYANTLQPNPLHVDWVYSWSQQETIIISGLTPNTTFDISFYDGFYWQDFTVQGQPELVAQIRPTAEQCGSPSTANSCNGIISGVFSDGSGQITIIGNALPGGWPGQDASTIAGMQILQSN
jgi:prepilin-type processing-associated H-X9-DG protein